MFLTDTTIKIIENEIKRHSNDEELINLLHQFNGQEIINFLLSRKDIINKMPKSVIDTSIEEIKLNYNLVLTHCSIEDLKLLEELISCCVDSGEIHNLSRKAMLNTTLKPELLHKKFPNFFTDIVLLNYSPVVLDEKYILKLKNLVPNINTGFFILQPITKKLIKKVLQTPNIEDLNHFFKAFSVSISEGKGIIDKKALKYCIHPSLIKDILPKYEFSLMQLLKVYKLAKKDNDCFIELIKSQKLPNFFVNHFINDDLMHYYLAHNKHCSDDKIIELYKSKKKINWIYINTEINISNHIKYANYLHEIDCSEIIEYNIQINKEKNEPISNLRTLSDYKINKDILHDAFLTKASELEIGIHLDNDNGFLFTDNIE